MWRKCPAGIAGGIREGTAMNEILTESAFFGAALTCVCYEAGLWVKKKTKLSVANPLLIATMMIITVLLVFRIEYDSYKKGADYIQYFLTPATVSLAVPLYRQLNLLKRYPAAILGGVVAGVAAAMGSIFVLSIVFGLTHEQYVTLLPKSITTAIGMGVSEKMGGIPALTIAAICITGITRAILAEAVCKLFRIEEPVAKGLAIGTGAHALGTSKAMELGEVEGAMSSLSIVVTGILTVLAVSVFADFI